MDELSLFIKERRKKIPILLMTHVIYGYPSVDKSLQMMRALLEKKVAILEVQFPFSDPVADGPTITNACHIALENKPKLKECLESVSHLAKEFPHSKVLLMSYLNPLLQFGIHNLSQKLAPNIAGVIIPDLPIDQHKMLLPLKEKNISPVWLMIPGMSNDRIKLLCEQAEGLIYCVSRKGVTGESVESNSKANELIDTLTKVKELTKVPIALGFGIASAEQIKAITGQVDVAVVGSALLQSYQQKGLKGFVEKVDQLLVQGSSGG